MARNHVLGDLRDLSSGRANFGIWLHVSITVAIVISCISIVRLLQYEHRCITAVHENTKLRSRKSLNVKSYRIKSAFSAVFGTLLAVPRRACLQAVRSMRTIDSI